MITTPAALWLLILLIPIALIFWIRYRTGARDLGLLGGRWRAERLLNVYVVKWFFASFAFLLFCALTVLALAGFSWGRFPVSDKYNGTDVALIIDVSRSMLAQDVYPSRLARSVAVVQGLLERSRQQRFSVVVFKGIGVQAIPLTDDTDVISSYMSSLSPDVLSAPGTDIEQGIDAALGSFEVQDGSRKIILLFTDGGSLSGAPDVAARIAGRRSIAIYPIAAGTEAGATIPLGGGKAVLDRSGEEVVTRLNRPLLDRIATASGGTVYSIDDPLLLTKLTELVNRGGGSELGGEFRFEPRDQYRRFLLPALIFLAFAAGIRVVRWRDTF